MEKRRRILSILLLAVFLPAFAASILHTHPEAVPESEECAECVHHLPHAGHISADSGGLSDCVLCHFLGLPYVVSAAVAVLSGTALRQSFYRFADRPYLAAHLLKNHTRAPPVFSFSLS